jgi:hypothetical protein
MAEDRANRAAEVSTERRRRNDLSGAPRLKLAIPDHIRDKLAAEGRTPRWVNDTGSRIADLTIRDDYDPVEGVDPRQVDFIDGKPVYAKLLSKPNDFIAEDRAKAESQRKAVETGMRTGKIPQPGAEAQPLQGAMGAPVYVDGDTKIGRANQILE